MKRLTAAQANVLRDMRMTGERMVMRTSKLRPTLGDEAVHQGTFEALRLGGFIVPEVKTDHMVVYGLADKSKFASDAHIKLVFDALQFGLSASKTDYEGGRQGRVFECRFEDGTTVVLRATVK